jgi:hypothetical protein
MAFPSVFESATTASLHERLDRLSTESTPQWGKMNVSQMVTHCCIPYEILYEGRKLTVNPVLRLFARLFLKSMMTDTSLPKRSAITAPEFIITHHTDLNAERTRLKAFIQRVEKDGIAGFEGRIHTLLGPLTAGQWSNLLYKHIDHHLRQFGV